MPLRNGTPFKFKPRGTCDTWDGMNSPPGGMSSLQDLIPDVSTPNAFQCRPALAQISNFPGLSAPGTVSWAIELNGYIYGLIGSARNPGHEEPFAYEIVNNTFLTVQGITSTNVPITQPTTGDWVPPTAAINGAYIAFTHPGFDETNGYFGYFDISGFTVTSSGNITSGSPTITGDFPLAGIQPGYLISGTGIPANSTVLNVANTSGNTIGDTNSSTSLTNVVGYIPVGSQVTGTGIGVGTTVTAISGTAGNYTVTISQAATGTATGIEIFYTGTTITLSANATATTNALSITITGGTLTSPLWASGNTTMNGLTAPPAAVGLFFNRFYFAVDDMVQYTDTLSFNRTSADQAITCGDSTVVTALSLFTLTTTTQGILQGLLAFKANTIFQITGDEALNTLAINSLNTAAGTIAPSSVTATPGGVFFMASDGIRVVQTDGTVSEPDPDIRLPFINALYPSRVSASYNSDVFRICVQNGGAANTPWQEYWFDLGREIWTGPHTCQQDVATPYAAGFICFSHLHPAKMFASYVTQISGIGFTEYGSPLNWIFATAPVGEDDSMLLNTVNEITINMSFNAASPPVTCTATDESNGVLATGTVLPPSNAATIWGFFTWGVAVWNGVQYGIRPFTIPWTNPLNFTKMIFQATAASSLGFKISNLRFVLQPANYYPPT